MLVNPQTRLVCTSLIAFFRGAKKSSKANLYECLCWCLCIVMLIFFYGGEFTVQLNSQAYQTFREYPRVWGNYESKKVARSKKIPVLLRVDGFGQTKNRLPKSRTIKTVSQSAAAQFCPLTKKPKLVRLFRPFFFVVWLEILANGEEVHGPRSFIICIVIRRSN